MSIFEHKPETIINIDKIIINLGEKHEGNRVHLILKQTINHSTYQIMALSIASNQLVLGMLGLVDAVTSAAVTGTFTSVGAVSDTPAAFTASVDADNDIVVTGVAAGAGNVTVTATAAYTDSTGTAQSQALTVVIPVTITAVVTADAVNLVVTFGNPTAAPVTTPPATPAS